MIKVKHLMESVEYDDGKRLWIEPIGLTRDLCQWCSVSRVLPHLGPPREVWEWYEAHPDGYEYFRGVYHEALARGPHRQSLQELSCISQNENITLLHQSDDPQHNTATALFEYLVDLRSYCPPGEVT
jgi:uncharacterized protein YeaO (DUF488 family)